MSIIYPTTAIVDTSTYLSVSLPTSIVSGNVLFVQSTNGLADLADQDGSGTREVVGIALETPTTIQIKTLTKFGTVTNLKFASPPTSSAQIGTPVYLSSTPGEATMTAPTTGTVYRLGVLMSHADLGGSQYNIMFMPIKVADLL